MVARSSADGPYLSEGGGGEGGRAAREYTIGRRLWTSSRPEKARSMNVLFVLSLLHYSYFGDVHALSLRPPDPLNSTMSLRPTRPPYAANDRAPIGFELNWQRWRFLQERDSANEMESFMTAEVMMGKLGDRGESQKE